ncbi:MAG TPA: cytochrome c [Gemmatimonadaceae bacterium]|nr:cytochrome c [Gemmatimonadaceae bacterium]
MKKLMLAVLVAGAAACGPPMKQTPIEEIPKLTKLDDVMDNQATVMDPLYKKIGTATFTDGDWAALTSAAARVQATSLKIKDFSKGAEFDALAMKLNQQAGELAASYSNKDAAAANTALGNMKATCKECHKKYR